MNFPKIMGILNTTPDSFSDGGKFYESSSAVKHTEDMIENGADIIDIGGESTRPGSQPVTESEEIERVIPVIKILKKNFPNIPVSVDTTKYEVARIAAEEGADIINDVSCLRNDSRLADLAAKYNLTLVIMHSRNTPENMQKSPHYNNLWKEIINELSDAVNIAKNAGVKNIVIDPGIGFAKNYAHNIEILSNLQNLEKLNLPILLGISRKSFISKMLDIQDPAERDIATAFIHSILLNKNVDIIRVHNVSILNTLRKIYNSINFD